MGRKRKYFTADDQYKAQLAWSNEYYLRNKELIIKKAKEKYHARKKTKM